jgi:acetyl-CoA acyltransferase
MIDMYLVRCRGTAGARADGHVELDQGGKGANMRQAVIVDAVRTPIGRRNGVLASMHAVELSALVLRSLVERTGIDPVEIEEVVWGCVTQIGDQSSNVARYAALAAGWPEQIGGTTVTRACGSSQQALDFGANAVIAGQYDVVVVGGVETMTRVPMGAARQVGVPYGPTVLQRYEGFSFSQGDSAELIADKWSLSREELDAFAARSHELAAVAVDSGSFDGQIVPVEIETSLVTRDEGIRRGTSVDTLSRLTPAFRSDGVIHAGNSSQISDGAAALLVMSAEKASALGLTPIARYCAGVGLGSDPVLMLTGPIPATQRLLQRTGLSIDDVGVFEVNEAFACVPLAWLRETGADPAKVNPNGGAIALGHPLGASGAILATRMVHGMRAANIEFGLQTMCEGGGTANATLLQLV